MSGEAGRTANDRPRPATAVPFSKRGDALVAVRPHTGVTDIPLTVNGETQARAIRPWALGIVVLACADERPASRLHHLRTRGPRRSRPSRTRPRRVELRRLRGTPLHRHLGATPGLEHLSRRLPERRIAIDDRRTYRPPDRASTDHGRRRRAVLAWTNLARCSARDGLGCRCARPNISRSAPRR